MEYYERLNIKEEWGDKHCNHPRLEKVFYSGAFLISYACVDCGHEFTIAQKMELLDGRKKIIKNNI